jgi:hypothetical protein
MAHRKRSRAPCSPGGRREHSPYTPPDATDGANPSGRAEGTSALELDVEALIPWARGIARGVRADYGFRAGSQEEMELEGAALLALVELHQRLDESRLPAGGNLLDAFRGWATDEIRSRCRRAAVQLRNGGTFRTTANPDARRIVVERLPTEKDEDGSGEVALPAREERDPPEEPWSVWDTTFP